jgi:hypothetical protein
MVGKSVVFTAEITNHNQQPVADVVVNQQADPALVVTQATDEGATPKGNGVVWSLRSIPPGRPIRLQVQCDCKQAGKACCRFAVTPANGQPVEGQACVDVAATAPPAGNAPLTSPPAVIPGRLRVTVDNYNKVTAGKDQVFLVQVKNDGDSAENDIVVTASLPPGSALVESGTSGPRPDIKHQSGQGLIRFDAVGALAPRATINYRVAVTTSQAGQITLQAAATSQRQTQPAVGRNTVEVLPRE